MSSIWFRSPTYSLEARKRPAGSLGFRKATADWRELLTDPDIDIIDITTPNLLHKEMALAAIAHGKHVYCEKPLAPTVAECAEMVAAAEKAGVVTQVGFNYLKNPMIFLAKDLIESGEIGEIRSVRGIHAEDFMMDASAPWSWRLDPNSGGGALADIGSHIIASLRHLVGPITSVLAETIIQVPARPIARGSSEMRAVEVDDITRAFVRFESGATGSFEANWSATGRKMQHDFEIYGIEGQHRLHAGADERDSRSGSPAMTSAAAATAPSGPAPSIRPTAPSASPPATRSASTT